MHRSDVNVFEIVGIKKELQKGNTRKCTMREGIILYYNIRYASPPRP